jgi:hypothetical protein
MPLVPLDMHLAGYSRLQTGLKNLVFIFQMTVTEGGDVAKYDAEFDVEEEDELLTKYKESRMDEMFPDEFDTPKDVLAKERFARYVCFLCVGAYSVWHSIQ